MMSYPQGKMTLPSTGDSGHLLQPWKDWYIANANPEDIIHYVVPVMSAGNMAPASQKNGRLDLNKTKTLASKDRKST